MERPNFQPIFTKKSDYCEKTNKKPINEFVPHQAITLPELVSRFERGQRLNVHANFRPGSNFEDITDEEALNRIRTENIDADDFPPYDAHDIVDVQNAMQEHEYHKNEFKERMKKKREQAQQAQQQQAQQAPEPTPQNPPVA